MRRDRPAGAGLRRLWLAALSRLVPREGREAWLNEWIAELATRPRVGLLDLSAPAEDALGLLVRRGRHSGLGRDVRSALRSLRRRPAFSAVVVLTMAIAIGANATVFGLVDATLLRPLPYERPDELAVVQIAFGRGDDLTPIPASGPEFLELREEARAFVEIAGYSTASWNLGSVDEPVRVSGAWVTPEFLDVLGVAPVTGRGFLREDGGEGAPEVAVIGHHLWRDTFGGNPAVVGREIRLDGVPTTVIGVLPSSFRFPAGEADVLRPTAIDPSDPGGRSSHWIQVLGRLRPGLSPGEARRETDALLARWQAERPEVHHKLGGSHPARVVGLREATVGETRRPLLLLMAAVGAVLLMACVNVANLTLVRVDGRAGELGVRRALGAGRAALLRQLGVESLVLAVAGGAAGIALAGWGIRWASRLAAGSLPPGVEAGLDGRVVLFSLVAAVLSGLLFGLGAAWVGSGTDPGDALRRTGRTGSSGRAGVTLRRVLVTGEVAAAVALVALTGVLGRSLASLMATDTGFRHDGVLVAGVSLPSAVYPGTRDVVEFHGRLRARLESAPGVEAVGAVRTLPLAGAGGWESGILLDRPVEREEDAVATFGYQVVSGRYFEALSIPVVAGRGFQPSDDADAPPVALINESAADAFFPGRSPLGQRVRLGAHQDSPNPPMTVVGVVGDVRQGSVHEEVPPQIFVPRTQAGAIYGGLGARSATLTVRSGLSPQQAAALLRAAVRDLDPDLSLTGVRTLEAHVARSMGDRRFLAFLMAGFSGVALLLGALGLYGVLGWVVARRTREIGIRLALGARRASVVASVLGEAAVLVGVGSLLGVAAALAAGGVLEGLVHDVSPGDPLALAAAPAVLLLVGLGAATLPARRAATVDPVAALRSE